MSDKAQFIIHENMPKDGDGCSNRSWRCERPNRDDMEKGRVNGTSIKDVRLECKRCQTCMMIFCDYHMKSKRHMEDCMHRSNEERMLLEEQRAEEVKLKREKLDEDNRQRKAIAEFDAKEKLRREAIEERNRKVREGK